VFFFFFFFFFSKTGEKWKKKGIKFNKTISTNKLNSLLNVHYLPINL